MYISTDKLDFWITKKYNVLFEGKHGVGKTAMVIDAFNKAGLKWLYYSASTMDPWVDMIGVPKEKKNSDGSSYLDLVRPKEFQNDEIEALFFDEFNRSHKKIRNAVMELIQFKSINGKKFHNLKVVWAAINPSEEEETYDVDRLDPAQEDRFHIKIQIPYKPNIKYFKDKYGSNGKAAIDWWGGLPQDIKNNVSPRRLDYAMDIYKNNGDLRDVLPIKSNISKLLTTLQHGPLKDKLDDLAKQDETIRSEWLANENNYAACVNVLLNPKYRDTFLPLIGKERISSLLSTTKTHHQDWFIENYDKVPVFKEVIDEITTANVNKKLVRKIKTRIRTSPVTTSKSVGKSPIIKLTFDYDVNINYDNNLNVVRRNLSRSITTERVTMIRRIDFNIPKEITEAEALRTIQALNAIAGRCHVVTLNRNGLEFFGPLNHALKFFYNHGTPFERINKSDVECIEKYVKKDSLFASRIIKS